MSTIYPKGSLDRSIAPAILLDSSTDTRQFSLGFLGIQIGGSSVDLADTRAGLLT